MNDEQRVAFVNAQVVCAHARIAGMEAANQHRLSMGYTIAYDADAFFAVPDEFGLGHNTVINFLMHGG